MINTISSILDRFIPFRIQTSDTVSRKLNHLLSLSLPGEYFEFETIEDCGDYLIEHYYNKKHNISLDLTVRYCMFIEGSYRSHFKVTAYKVYCCKEITTN